MRGLRRYAFGLICGIGTIAIGAIAAHDEYAPAVDVPVGTPPTEIKCVVDCSGTCLVEKISQPA